MQRFNESHSQCSLGGTSNLSLVKQRAQHLETFAQEPLQYFANATFR